MGRRIIFTVTNDLAFDQRMQRICGSLAAAGYAVTLVGRLKNDSRSLTNQPYQQVRLKHMLFSKGKLFYLEFNIRLLFYLLFVRTDAICSIDLDTALPGILVAKLRKSIIFSTPTNCLPMYRRWSDANACKRYGLGFSDSPSSTLILRIPLVRPLLNTSKGFITGL